MKRDKYMGLDVHQATTVAAVIDAEGKIVMERPFSITFHLGNLDRRRIK